jgi:hypothetical protein
VGFVVDKVALEYVFLQVIRFSPANIIPPLPHIHSYIIWEMDKGPVSGCRSTETYSHYIETITITRGVSLIKDTVVWACARLRTGGSNLQRFGNEDVKEPPEMEGGETK